MCLAFAGCGSASSGTVKPSFSREKYGDVTPGMLRADVEKMLGPGTEQRKDPLRSGQRLVVWECDGRVFGVIYHGDRVFAKAEP
jgi:hypothetical protein